MNYNIEIINDSDFMHLCVTGIYDNNNALLMLKEIIQIFKTKLDFKYYIDMSALEVTSTIGSNFFQANFTGNELIGLPHKIAVLGNIEYKDSFDFFGLVARNAGVNVFYFYTKDEAMNWLLEE